MWMSAQSLRSHFSTAHTMRLGFVCPISSWGTVGNRQLHWLDFWSGVVLCTGSSGTIKHSVKGHGARWLENRSTDNTLIGELIFLEFQHASEIQILERCSQTYPRVMLELSSFSSWFFPLYVSTIICSFFKNSNFLKWNQKHCSAGMVCCEELFRCVCRTYYVLVLWSPWAQYWH